MKNHSYRSYHFIKSIAPLMAVFIICISLMYPHTVYAKKDSISISTINEFYNSLSDQIINHEAQRIFYVASDDLLDRLTVRKDFWDGFDDHYNPDNPLQSGCYTNRLTDGGQASWFTDSRTFNCQLKYRVTKESLDAYLLEMKTIADELRTDDDYESVKNAHDYLIKRVEYDDSTLGENYTDVEGFRDGKMVCQGYSMATFVLLSYMGIPVRIVRGEAGTENDMGRHAWNIVQVDGKWYNLDTTWDDAGGNDISYAYFLKSNEDFPMHYPSGLYAKSEFTGMISTESYKSPNFASDKAVIWILILIVIVAIDVYIIYSKRRQG